MTTSQFKALSDDASERAAAGEDEQRSDSPARIQLLTEDACVIEHILTSPAAYARRIANFLEIPEKSVLIHPPAIKGTVGLLQISTSDARHTTQLLGVKQCVGSLNHMSLLEDATSRSERQPTFETMASAPAPATAGLSPAAAAGDAKSHVVLPLRCSNVNYDMLMTNYSRTSTMTELMKESIVAVGKGEVSSEGVELALYPDVPGSMLAKARVAVPAGTEQPMAALLRSSVSWAINPRLDDKKGEFASVSNGIIKCIAEKPGIEPATYAAVQAEQNRAWIAPWSIVVLPPFAKLGAKRLLEMISTPTSELARLLPKTVAYVPGVADPSLGFYNAASEMRLPPPVENSFSVGLPKVKLEGEDLKWQEEMARRATMSPAARLGFDVEQANEAVNEGELTGKMIEEARRKFLRASRARAEAIRDPRALDAPDIMSPALMS